MQSAFIHGVAVSTGWADASRSLTDLIFNGVTAALADARVDIADVDSVVLASHDLIDGLSLSSMVTAPAAGAYLRDEIRLSEDSLAAASLGAARIQAGESRFTLVAAWGRGSEGDQDATERAAFDPFSVQPFGLREIDVSALRLSAWLQRFGSRQVEREAAALARMARAARNSRALAGHPPHSTPPFPLHHNEGPVLADIVVAAVLGSDPSPVRITGFGHSTDVSNIGERDLLGMPSLTEAVSRALAEANRSILDIDLFEIDGLTLPDEAIGLEALKIAPPGAGFDIYARSSAINPSGGSAAGSCYPTMGLNRLAECYLQLTGRANGVQLTQRPVRAIAVGTSPVAAQVHAAAVLEVQ